MAGPHPPVKSLLSTDTTEELPPPPAMTPAEDDAAMLLQIKASTPRGSRHLALGKIFSKGKFLEVHGRGESGCMELVVEVGDFRKDAI